MSRSGIFSGKLRPRSEIFIVMTRSVDVKVRLSGRLRPRHLKITFKVRDISGKMRPMSEILLSRVGTWHVRVKVRCFLTS